jgi:hypothetical protein
VDALTPLAERSDLETRMKRVFETSEDEDEADSVLDEASEIVREESGQTWLDPDNPSIVTAPRIVRIITLRVAERRLRNPDGLSAETAGDYSYQRNGVGADGSSYLTEWELGVLHKYAGRTGMWNQPLTKGDCYADMVFLEDSFGLELFPVGDVGIYPY